MRKRRSGTERIAIWVFYALVAFHLYTFIWWLLQ
jgi:hypothetical protein